MPLSFRRGTWTALGTGRRRPKPILEPLPGFDLTAQVGVPEPLRGGPGTPCSHKVAGPAQLLASPVVWPLKLYTCTFCHWPDAELKLLSWADSIATSSFR